MYVRADDERLLRESEEDPAEWVRRTVRRALDLRRLRKRPDLVVEIVGEEPIEA